jgi:hypothetical protein
MAPGRPGTGPTPGRTGQVNRVLATVRPGQAGRRLARWDQGNTARHSPATAPDSAAQDSTGPDSTGPGSMALNSTGRDIPARASTVPDSRRPVSPTQAGGRQPPDRDRAGSTPANSPAD